MKSLVIAEKPSVARDIARVLKCQENINGAIEGSSKPLRRLCISSVTDKAIREGLPI